MTTKKTTKKVETTEGPTGGPPDPGFGRTDDDGRVWDRRTGVELDPEDGRPMFADGMSRQRWLERNVPGQHIAEALPADAAGTESGAG